MKQNRHIVPSPSLAQIALASFLYVSSPSPPFWRLPFQTISTAGEERSTYYSKHHTAGGTKRACIDFFERAADGPKPDGRILGM